MPNSPSRADSARTCSSSKRRGNNKPLRREPIRAVKQLHRQTRHGKQRKAINVRLSSRLLPFSFRRPVWRLIVRLWRYKDAL
jgi:hypothetical protein